MKSLLVGLTLILSFSGAKASELRIWDDSAKDFGAKKTYVDDRVTYFLSLKSVGNRFSLNECKIRRKTIYAVGSINGSLPRATCKNIGREESYKVSDINNAMNSLGDTNLGNNKLKGSLNAAVAVVSGAGALVSGVMTVALAPLTPVCLVTGAGAAAAAYWTGDFALKAKKDFMVQRKVSKRQLKAISIGLSSDKNSIHSIITSDLRFTKDSLLMLLDQI